MRNTAIFQVCCIAWLARTPSDIRIIVALASSWMQDHLFCWKPLELQPNLGSILCSTNHLVTYIYWIYWSASRSQIAPIIPNSSAIQGAYQVYRVLPESPNQTPDVLIRLFLVLFVSVGLVRYEQLHQSCQR